MALPPAMAAPVAQQRHLGVPPAFDGCSSLKRMVAVHVLDDVGAGKRNGGSFDRRPRRATVRIRRGPPGSGGDGRARHVPRRRARFSISRSALLGASSSRGRLPRNALRTGMQGPGGRRSVMLKRALWTWQRWIGVWRPKVLRIALDSALAPSMMNRTCDRLEATPDQVVELACCHGRYSSVADGGPRSCRGETLIAVAIDADGGQQHRPASMWMPSIWMISRSRLDRSAAIHRFMRSADNATNRRDTADLDSTRSLRRGHVALRQADGAAELARRDVDQHQVERPLAQQVLRQRRLPARQDLTSSPWRARTRGRSISTLPPWKPTFPVVLPQRCPSLPSARP